MSASTVALMHTTFTRMFRLVTEFALTRPDSRVFALWTAAPSIQQPALPRTCLNNDGPPLEAIRLAWQDLERRIAFKLGIEPGDDELAAMEAMPDTRLVHSFLFRDLRARVALYLLVGVGGRIEALASLCIGDYLRDYRGRAPDYLVGPALVLRPGKTVHADTARVKMIPPEAGLVIDVYLRYLERVSDILCRWKQGGWQTPPLRSDNTPLLVAGRQNWRPWGAEGIRLLVSGKTPAPSGRGGMVPLIERRSGYNPDLPVGMRRYVGYHPHGYRHAASIQAERAGAEWNDRHPATGGQTQYSPGAYAAALLDQEMPEHRLRALYGDRNTEATRELLAARAVYGIWRLLATDDGARKDIDRERYRECRDLSKALELEQRRLNQRFDEVGRAARRNRINPGVAAIELLELQKQIREVAEHKNQCERELHVLRYDRKTWIPVPDDVIHVEPFDLDQDDESQGRTEIVTERVRGWFTPGELAHVAGCRPSTVSRWLQGQHLPSRPERRPWEADDIPVDASLGVRFRRIPVERIKPSFWATRVMREAREQILSKWPTAQGWRNSDGSPGPRCLATLKLR